MGSASASASVACAGALIDFQTEKIIPRSNPRPKPPSALGRFLASKVETRITRNVTGLRVQIAPRTSASEVLDIHPSLAR